jgi:DNA repair protein RecO (recombination protein O)
MTTRYSTRALVFKKDDRNEADRVFSVFTNDFGRLDVHAKAIRKTASKLRGGIDIFSLSEIEFIQGKNKKTLTDATTIKKFRNIPQDPRRFAAAHNIGKILDSFIRGQERDKEIFELLKDVFCKLDDQKLKSEKCALTYYYFLWNALSSLGYRAEVQECITCREKVGQNDVYFSNKHGGILCKKCARDDAQKINADIVKVIRMIFKKEWQILSKLRMEMPSRKLFKEVSDNYYSYVLSK